VEDAIGETKESASASTSFAVMGIVVDIGASPR
jgi:hypothetical protein